MSMFHSFSGLLAQSGTSMSRYRAKVPRIAVGQKLAMLLFIGILCFNLPVPAQAGSAAGATTSADEPAKIRQLVDILSDPAVQAWLKKQQKEQSASTTGPVESGSLLEFWGGRVNAIRAHLAALVVALPLLPAEFDRAAGILTTDLGDRGPVKILVLFGVFLAIGLGAEWLVSRATADLRRWVMSLPVETVGQR